MSTSRKIKINGLKSLFGPIFEEKSLSFKISIYASQKTRIEQFSNSSRSFEIKSITLPASILTNISKIDENLDQNTQNVKNNRFAFSSQNMQNVNKNNGLSSTIHKTSNLNNSL